MWNCGTLGNVCPTWWLNGNGATCAYGICQPTSCFPGFTFDYTARICRNTATDAFNWCVELFCTLPPSDNEPREARSVRATDPSSLPASLAAARSAMFATSPTLRPRRA